MRTLAFFGLILLGVLITEFLPFPYKTTHYFRVKVKDAEQYGDYDNTLVLLIDDGKIISAATTDSDGYVEFFHRTRSDKFSLEAQWKGLVEIDGKEEFKFLRDYVIIEKWKYAHTANVNLEQEELELSPSPNP